MKKKKKRKRGSEIEMLFFIHVSKKNKKEHGSDLHCYAHRFFSIYPSLISSSFNVGT